MKIHKGDTIQLMVGKDAGKIGKVLRVDPKNATAVIEGLNLFKRHSRPKKRGEKGQVISLPGPLNISKIMLLCPSCKKPTRTGYRIEKNGAMKVRLCKKCGASL